MKVVIKGFIQTSMLDWDGMIVSTLYVPGCNFRCPFCQNSGLILKPDEFETIPLEKIKDYLVKNKDWVDGVCLTGGEPCMYEDLAGFIREIKKTGAKLKLDTNGAFPDALKDLMAQNIVDYIAIDIKAPLEEEPYKKSAGIENKMLFDRVKESIEIVMKSNVDYEFRTTVVPTLHGREDIEKIAGYIKGAKKYALQNFKPQDTLNPEFMKIKPYNPEELKEICSHVSKYVKKCVVRGV